MTLTLRRIEDRRISVSAAGMPPVLHYSRGREVFAASVANEPEEIIADLSSAAEDRSAQPVLRADPFVLVVAHPLAIRFRMDGLRLPLDQPEKVPQFIVPTLGALALGNLFRKQGLLLHPLNPPDVRARSPGDSRQ